jgi:hypothetical protein
MPGRNGIPSVTEVLGVFTDFSRIRPDVLAHAAERGTIVHQACAAIAEGLWSLGVPPDCAGYVKSFERWFDMVVDTVHMVEAELTHSLYGYMGHLDLCVTLRGEEDPRVIDLKTPVTEGATWKAQISAYEALVIENTDLQCRRSGSLRLKADGGFPKFNQNDGDIGAFNAFLNALSAYRYFKS